MNAHHITAVAGILAFSASPALAEFVWSDFDREIDVIIETDTDSYGTGDYDYSGSFWSSSLSLSLPTTTGQADLYAEHSSEFNSAGFVGQNQINSDSSNPLPSELFFSWVEIDISATVTFDTDVEIRIQFEESVVSPSSTGRSQLYFDGQAYIDPIDIVLSLSAGSYSFSWSSYGSVSGASPGVSSISTSSMMMTIVPAPSTLALAGLGLVGAARRRR